MPYVQNIDNSWMASTLWLRDVSVNRHATLTLRIRVRLDPIGSTDYEWQDTNGVTQVTETIDWDGRAMRWFKRHIKEKVEAAWSQRFWLVPDSHWVGSFNRYGGEGRESWIPGIQCRLIVDLDYGSASPHAIINCYRLPRTAEGVPTGFSRSSMNTPGGLSGLVRGCHWELGLARGSLDTGDVYPTGTGQYPVVHEFGHYLGLDHVNAAAARSQGVSTNSAIAYGPQGSFAATDYMGRGTRFATWHAYPWCRRLREHLTDPYGLITSERWASRNPITWQTATGNPNQRGAAQGRQGIVNWQVTMDRPRVRRDHVSDPLIMPEMP